MNYIIILFGTATIVAGIIILINPEKVFGLIRRKTESLGLHLLAVVVRIILGVALMMYATESKYPTAISILGWISIVAASVLGIMGRTNFRRLMSWALNLAPSFGRIGGFLAILFGGFLINMTSSRSFIRSWTKSGNLWPNISIAILCFMDTQTMLALKHITCHYHEKGLNLYTAI